MLFIIFVVSRLQVFRLLQTDPRCLLRDTDVIQTVLLLTLVIIVSAASSLRDTDVTQTVFLLNLVIIVSVASSKCKKFGYCFYDFPDHCKYVTISTLGRGRRCDAVCCEWNRWVLSVRAQWRQTRSCLCCYVRY